MTPAAYMYIIKAWYYSELLIQAPLYVGYVNQHTDNGIYQCYRILVRAIPSDFTTPVSAFEIITLSFQKVCSVLLNNYLNQAANINTILFNNSYSSRFSTLAIIYQLPLIVQKLCFD